jgi:transcription-repair coupling factor (superfamily II helicase)
LEPGPSISLPLTAHLPAQYIEDEPTRLSFYQRFATVARGAELGELVDELTDRFGPLPEPVQNLIYVISLRLEARRAGLQAVQSTNGEVVLRFERLPSVDVVRLGRVIGAPLRSGSNQIRLPRGRGSAWMAQLRTLVESLPEPDGRGALAQSGARAQA